MLPLPATCACVDLARSDLAAPFQAYEGAVWEASEASVSNSAFRISIVGTRTQCDWQLAVFLQVQYSEAVGRCM